MKSLLVNAVAKKTRVVASLFTESGNTYYGVNIESSCHSLSICAERNAIFQAITNEGPSMKILHMEVYAEKEGKEIDIKPCGGCRQLMAEYSTKKSMLLGHPLGYWMPNAYL